MKRQRGIGAHDTGQVSCIKSDEIVSYKYMARRCFPTKDIVYLKNECVLMWRKREDGERDRESELKISENLSKFMNN